jgi:hypothetical protein
MTKVNLTQLKEQVDVFNKKYNRGDVVSLRLDNGTLQKVTVTHPATIIGGHSAVGWFEEINGCYLLERVCD